MDRSWNNNNNNNNKQHTMHWMNIPKHLLSVHRKLNLVRILVSRYSQFDRIFICARKKRRSIAEDKTSFSIKSKNWIHTHLHTHTQELDTHTPAHTHTYTHTHTHTHTHYLQISTCIPHTEQHTCMILIHDILTNILCDWKYCCCCCCCFG